MILIFSFFLASGQKSEDKPEIRLPEISEELISMRDEDQKLRKNLSNLRKKGKRNSKKFIYDLKEVKSIERSNTGRSKDILEEYGWSAEDNVGRSASNSGF